MFPLIRGAKCAIVMISKPLQSDKQDAIAPARYFAVAQNVPYRIVIRRIQAGQVISITTASSSHPHFTASQFSDSFERSSDIPDTTVRQSCPTPEVHRRGEAAIECAGGPLPTTAAAGRDLQTDLILSDRNAERYDSEGVAA